jgi:hypothetical protein
MKRQLAALQINEDVEEKNLRMGNGIPPFG